MVIRGKTRPPGTGFRLALARIATMSGQGERRTGNCRLGVACGGDGTRTSPREECRATMRRGTAASHRIDLPATSRRVSFQRYTR
jgi:hypothetical protein